jgi:CRP-like cAMP-binding protein
MTLADALRNVPLFANLELRDLQILAERSRVRSFSAGDLVLMEQGEGTSLYILLTGWVSVERQTISGRHVLIAERGPGEHFGEMSLLDGLGHSAGVMAVTDCQVLIVGRDAFAKTFTEHPSVAFAVVRTLSGRLSSTDGRFDTLQKH